MMHACELIYNVSKTTKKYGDVKGHCCVLDKKAVGLPLNKWIRKSFTDVQNLGGGDIVSNEALFCFDEANEEVQKRANKEKPQHFRTYSHIVHDDNWYCLTKADKRKMYELIIREAELVSLSDSGQKHLVFKHKRGFWQLEELYIKPNIAIFQYIHNLMSDLLKLEFNQFEIYQGNYSSKNLMKVDLKKWKQLEKELCFFRRKHFDLFHLSSFLMFKE